MEPTAPRERESEVLIQHEEDSGKGAVSERINRLVYFTVFSGLHRNNFYFLEILKSVPSRVSSFWFLLNKNVKART